MATNYDKIAKVYDMLSRTVFGKSIVKAQTGLLTYIPAHSHVLLVGGGTGWILEEITKLHPTGLTIDYVESSAQMIALSEKKNCGDNIVNFINLPIENYNHTGQYEVILTPFLFDNFKPDKTRAIFNGLNAMLKNKGLWLYADFVYNENDGAVWQKVLLKVMYTFFRVTCNIETDTIENMEPHFIPEYKKIFQNEFYGGFIKSVAYQKR